jgi:integrase
LSPIRWRRLYALAIYLYARASELRAIEWADVDLEHGIIFVHRTLDDDGNHDSTKGEVPRRFKIEPELLPLLKTLHKESGGVGRVFDPFPLEKHLAPMLRRDLKRAGVVRAELFVTDKTRRQMTFHDLRSTGITWMAVRGDEPLKIKQRAGHKQFVTTEGYIREAESVREGFGVPFPPLPTDLVSSGISSERLGRNGHVYKITKEIGVGEAGFEPATTSTQSSCTTGLCDSPKEPDV